MGKCCMCDKQLADGEGINVQMTLPASMMTGMYVNGRWEHPKSTRKRTVLCEECGAEVAQNLKLGMPNRGQEGMMGDTTDNKTTELLRLLAKRGVEPTKSFTRIYKGYANPVNHYTHWQSPCGSCSYHEMEEGDSGSDALTVFSIYGHNIEPEQVVAATLGIDRDEVYNAGFDNGVKATLQQLDGLLSETDDASDIKAWIDEQWKQYES